MIFSPSGTFADGRGNCVVRFSAREASAIKTSESADGRRRTHSLLCPRWRLFTARTNGETCDPEVSLLKTAKRVWVNARPVSTPTQRSRGVWRRGRSARPSGATVRSRAGSTRPRFEKTNTRQPRAVASLWRSRSSCSMGRELETIAMARRLRGYTMGKMPRSNSYSAIEGPRSSSPRCRPSKDATAAGTCNGPPRIASRAALASPSRHRRPAGRDLRAPACLHDAAQRASCSPGIRPQRLLATTGRGPRKDRCTQEAPMAKSKLLRFRAREKQDFPSR